ncbi:type 1 glutamine amidotransferase family protein [Paenibacillus sp.]|uniref:type 1 glutamine amidotransferase family protein n=1 Tax=Paenibacillus sp. TaxID=58172 RepID=UPI0028A93284|nr:type 1 glutamine amidotransferase family protein [Paenibacillus sp.]
MKKEVLIFISNGYADWEAGYISAELNKPESEYTVRTVSLTSDNVQSMGGFTVVPDYTIDSLPAQFEMLILIGGTGWKDNSAITPVIEKCINDKTPISAICDATTFLAEHGYLDNIPHTGNSLDYLKEYAPNYKGHTNFIEKQAVSSDYIITANGTASLEFAREVMKKLDGFQVEKTDGWYNFFKNGFYQE